MNILHRVWEMVHLDIAIDLGTANTLLAVRSKGVLIREPTVLVRHKKNKDTVAVGSEAKKMLGKTPATLEAIRPLKHGVIADFEATEALLTRWIKEVIESYGRWWPVWPRVIVGIPSGITEVERRAVEEAALAAGARRVWLVEEPMAAAIGSGAPVEDPTGVLIVDIGGGTTEIAAISLSGMVVKRSLRMAGDEFDQAVIQYVRTKYGLLIGESTAERVKMTIGSVWTDVETHAKKSRSTTQMVIRGRGLESGVPTSLSLTRSDIARAIAPIVQQILVAVQDTVEEIPPELAADILERGIILAGGGALIDGLDSAIAEYTKMPVWVADDPLTCVVRGCLALFEKESLLARVRLVTGLRQT